MRCKFSLVVAIATAVMLAGGGAGAQSIHDEPAHNDPVRGERNFKRCAACHSMKNGIHKAGPSLAGMFGRRAATVAGYHYSNDLKAAGDYGLIWDRQSIDGFLQDPSRFLKAYLGKKRRARSKMKMKYRDHQFRHNIAAYLKRETLLARVSK